jgi:hypothetical protein
MAGFGAGFGKAFGGSLEAAGKLHQQEQMRSREYERAKADRQAERLEDRAWEVGDKEKEKEDRAAEQPHRYSKGPDGKFYYTRLDGTKVEKDANDPGVRLYLQDEEKRGQERTMFGLEKQQIESRLAVDRAQIGSLNASAYAARRDGGPKVEMSKTVDTFAESLAKNKKVFARSNSDMESFINILRDYGFKNGADLGREYMNSNPKAMEAMNLAQDHLYFPEESELTDRNRLKNQRK